MKYRSDAKNAFVNLGVVLHELGDFKGARDSYERALKISPDIPAVLYNLALLHEQQDSQLRGREAL